MSGEPGTQRELVRVVADDGTSPDATREMHDRDRVACPTPVRMDRMPCMLQSSTTEVCEQLLFLLLFKVK